MSDMKKKKLGRGLDALLGGKPAALDAAPAKVPAPVAPAAAPPAEGERLLFLDPAELLPNPKQPRRHFDEEALAELAASIRRDGVQEPIIVRPGAGGKYEIVSGERRCRASILADLRKVPAVCRPVSDDEMLKLGLIENVQREDLNAMELAAAYRDLMDLFKWTQEEVADAVGKRRATVANTLRLLQLPDEVGEMVSTGALTMGHARAILGLPSPAEQLALARKAAKDGLSVRQVEQIVASRETARKKPARPAPAKDPNITGVEDDLRRRLGTKVFLKPQGDGKRGRIEIEYYSNDDLDRLISLLRKG